MPTPEHHIVLDPDRLPAAQAVQVVVVVVGIRPVLMVHGLAELVVREGGPGPSLLSLAIRCPTVAGAAHCRCRRGARRAAQQDGFSRGSQTEMSGVRGEAAGYHPFRYFSVAGLYDTATATLQPSGGSELG